MKFRCKIKCVYLKPYIYDTLQAASPACTELETIVVDWLGTLINTKTLGLWMQTDPGHLCKLERY